MMNGRTIMKRKDDNGSMAARLSFAAGVLLVLLAGATEARDTNNSYSEYNIFRGNIEKMLLRLKEETENSTYTLDVISVYRTISLLALGSKGETQRQLLDELNYSSTDDVMAAAALLNKTIPTYSQFSIESYIDLSKEAELDSEFDHMVTEYMPLVVKRNSKQLCKSCSERDFHADPLTEKQQVCFSSYVDYKADWAKQFDPTQTSKTASNKFPGNVRNINLMSRSGLALYKEDKDQFKMQMLTIPFASLDSVIILMKPNDGSSLDTFADRIYSGFDILIKNLINQQAPTNVKIQLPKYKDTWNIDFDAAYTNIDMRILSRDDAETAILKEYPNTFIKYYDTEIKFEMNEEGINFKARTVANNVYCNGIPERKIPTLKKSSVQSPFAVPEFVSLVAGIANETLVPASKTVIEFSGTSPFMYFILTTDFTILRVGEYYGY